MSEPYQRGGTTSRVPRAALAARSHAQGITTQNNFLEQSLIIIVTIITLLPFSVIYLLL